MVNAIDNKYCSKCSYPLVPSAFDEIKANEDTKFRAIEERFNNMQSMLEKLITGLREVTDQQQVNIITESLFSSGALKVETRKKYLQRMGYFLDFLDIGSGKTIEVRWNVLGELAKTECKWLTSKND